MLVDIPSFPDSTGQANILAVDFDNRFEKNAVCCIRLSSFRSSEKKALITEAYGARKGFSV